jgi:hypothetical protein
MGSQVRGLSQAARNVNDGVSMLQTAEGALSATSAMLQRLRELGVQSANGTNSASDRQALNREATQLIAEINRIAQTTEFNGQKLLDGSSGTTQFQVGANANQTISANFQAATTSALGRQTADIGGRIPAGVIPNPSDGVFFNQIIYFLTTPRGTTTINMGFIDPTLSTQAAAIDLAGAFNAQSEQTGVTALAYTKGRLSGLSAPGHVSFTLYGSIPDHRGHRHCSQHHGRERLVSPGHCHQRPQCRNWRDRHHHHGPVGAGAAGRLRHWYRELCVVGDGQHHPDDTHGLQHHRHRHPGNSDRWGK